MSRTLRSPLPVLALLGAALLALAGCGGGSGQDTTRLLRDTFGSAEKPVTSGRLSFVVRVRAAGIKGLPSPLRISLSGPFQSGPKGQTPKFDFDLGLTTRDGSVTIGVISTGRRGWVKLGQRAYTLTPGQFGQLGGKGSPSQPSRRSSGISLGSLGVDPRRWLTGVQDLGVVEVGGAKVVHLRAGVNVPRLLDDLDRLLQRAGGLGAVAGVRGGISASSRDAIEQAVQSATVDVWTGERDHQLRRLLVVAKVDTPEQRNGRVSLDLAVAGLNEPQAIGPPANPRPLSELQTALAVLATRRDAASGTAAPAPKPKAGQGYEACVTAAGTDLAKAQACASLLR